MGKTTKGQIASTRSNTVSAGSAAIDIADRLKSFYASVEAEPIPDHLLSLLEKLDQAERTSNADGNH